jgi:hypothetical protein
MSTPQQPELARSGHTPADPDHAQELADPTTARDTAAGPVPDENRPGHHPDHDQDKPNVRVRPPTQPADEP